MEQTLYLTDLDGTLLGCDAAVSPCTKEIVNGLIGRGMLFTYATARSYHSASVVTAGVDWKLPLAVFNGTFLVAPDDGAILRRNVLDQETVAGLLEQLEALGASPLVYAIIDGRERVSWISGRETAGISAFLNSRKGDARLRPVPSPGALQDGMVFYVSVLASRGQNQALLERLGRYQTLLHHNLQPDTYDTDAWWLELFHKDASKAQALQALKEHTGAARVVCFGDNRNDIPMFLAADACYAVENACPELKAVAAGILPSNDRDGVALWLRDHGLGT